ncbi:MAG: hypothetical protein FJ311_04800 [Rhodospirillales bacterium]|nr:hypothetical protein [Rhodospirillales bacterium]
MSLLPNLFITRFDGLRHPAPVLVQVVDSPRRVTVRTWAESPLVDQARPDIDLDVHGDLVPGRTFGDGVVDGSLLAPRLAGLAFKELGAVALDIGVAAGLHEWSDMARWMFPLDLAGAPSTPYNARALTVNSKATGTRHLLVEQANCALVAFVYFRQLDFTEASFLVIGHPRHGAIGRLAERAKRIAPEKQADYTRRSEPRIAIGGPETIPVGGEAELACRLVDAKGRPAGIDTEFFLEATGGHLPLRRVPAPAGEAAVRIIALGNRPGDSIRVKAGFRHVSGLAEHMLTVA